MQQPIEWYLEISSQSRKGDYFPYVAGKITDNGKEFLLNDEKISHENLVEVFVQIFNKHALTHRVNNC
jgi:hypothetical protein